MGLIFRRGQEEAPIELLIAVTVLTFVLIIGFYSYDRSCSAQFEQKMRSSLSGFAGAIEQLYQGGVGTSYPITVDFSPIGCASGDIDSVRMVRGDTGFCKVRLGVEDCLMLAVRMQDKTLEEEMFMAEAVNIPWQTTKVHYVDQTLRCTLSILEASIVFGNLPNPADPEDTLTLEHCGWKMRLYTLTLKKVAPNEIHIIKG